MLNDAFVKAIADIAVKASGPVVATIPGGPDHQFLLRHPSGEFTIEEVGDTPLEHAVRDIDSLIRKAEDLHGGKGDVWFDRGAVTATKGRDTVRLVFSYSPQIALLQSWEGQAAAIEHARFVYLLRTTLAGCFPQYTNLLDLVRRVDFKKGQDMAQQIDKGRVSLSRSMIAEAVGADKLPDTVTFAVPIWAEASMQMFVRPVTVALDLDAQSEKFMLTPLAGSIERAIGSAEVGLGERLAQAAGDETALNFYYGVF